MSQLLKGKTAIITGSSRGIGRAIAQTFAENGADLVIHGTRKSALEELQYQILKSGVRCEYIAGDIGDYTTAQRLTEICLQTYGKIDILVNNAGINSRYSFTDLPLEEWDNMLRINLTGVFYACKCVVPSMLERKSGCIINMSSSAGKTAHPNASICYGVSKAGINSLTQKLAYDLAPSGIRVNAVCPGPIETDMSLQWTPEYREKALSAIPLRRLGKGLDVANVALFLASDLSDFIVGESINVNGGKYMN
ncbi:3-oxoacyl-[acyl-carrier-protein] reductase [Oscillibacter valericigenes Sjm18-20]|nr:3-oxoacyl-[acyl-carrier-protein] reductase [Oscillibacter valericigenes Sjm18-20]